MRKNVILSTLAVSLLGISGNAQAQPDAWGQQVQRLLREASSMASQNGLRQIQEPKVGSLREGRSDAYRLELSAGVRYQFIGVCDNDCSDLDLRLFNPAGQLVTEDVLTDDTPVLNVTPGATGIYTVRAVMTACSSEPCRYGVGIYGPAGRGSYTPPVDRPDDWARQVGRLLNQAASIARQNGMRQTSQPLTGSLREGASAEHTVQLSAGTAYQVVGVCDNDCSDFDLRLFDRRGRMVAEDVLTDDTPVLSITPRFSGTYTVRAVMTSCSSSPCRYGIGVYGRGDGDGGPLGSQGDDQDQWSAQVGRLLAQASSMARQNGMRPAQQPFSGSLRPGASAAHTLQLNAGTRYQLIGVCDNDCSDFDLRLFDPRGRMVAEDVLTDDTPVLNVTPRFSGTYTVRAVMTRCSSAPCRYGIGVYTGRGGSVSSSDDEGGDQWSQQVRNLLRQAASMATGNGMRPTHEPYIGSLRTNGSGNHTLELNAGTSYSLIGVCDNDCSDLDLRLFDPSGREVASDLLTDDTPVVNVTPRRGGTYTVRAIMTACSDQPCRYGIGVYGR